MCQDKSSVKIKDSKKCKEQRQQEIPGYLQRPKKNNKVQSPWKSDSAQLLSFALHIESLSVGMETTSSRTKSIYGQKPTKFLYSNIISDHALLACCCGKPNDHQCHINHSCHCSWRVTEIVGYQGDYSNLDLFGADCEQHQSFQALQRSPC